MHPSWRNAEKSIPVQHPQIPLLHSHGLLKADAKDANGLAGRPSCLKRSACRDCADILCSSYCSLLPAYLHTNYICFYIFGSVSHLSGVDFLS